MRWLLAQKARNDFTWLLGLTRGGQPNLTAQGHAADEEGAFLGEHGACRDGMHASICYRYP